MTPPFPHHRRHLGCLLTLTLSACFSRDVRVDDSPDTGDMADTADTSEVSETVDPSASSSAGESNSTGTTDSDTTDGSTTGAGFVDADIDIGPCGEYPKCSTWEPDCPEGSKCSIRACDVGSGAWDAYVCVPVLGDDQVGESCRMLDDEGSEVSGLDSCAAGAACFFVDPETGEGICTAHCTGSPEAPLCPEDSTCAIASEGVPSLCLPWCDPILQDCNPDAVCNYDPGLERLSCSFGTSDGMKPYGSPCAYINACNPGLACIDAAYVPEPECVGAEGCCSPYCDVNAPTPCPGEGQVCESVWFDPPAISGFDHVGICRLP